MGEGRCICRSVLLPRCVENFPWKMVRLKFEKSFLSVDLEELLDISMSCQILWDHICCLPSCAMLKCDMGLAGDETPFKDENDKHLSYPVGKKDEDFSGSFLVYCFENSIKRSLAENL